jgi:hypothetical protein
MEYDHSMTMPRQVIFEQVGLGTALKRYQLFVPPNQREYAWRTDIEVDKLFKDFAEALDDQFHFLGSIVTIPRDGTSLEVVDGQQRLATTAILLAEMRNHAKNIGETFIKNSINTEFLFTGDRSKRANVPHLTLNTDDNELFRQIIENDPGLSDFKPIRESHELLLGAKEQAAQFVNRIVSTRDIKTQGDLLNKWISFVEHNAFVVLIQVPKPADAYKMFETLNDRGVGISQVDLIKNQIFGRATDRHSEVQTKWTSMRSTLESSDQDDIVIDFIRHSLIAMSGHVVQSDLYNRVQTIVRSEQAAIDLSITLDDLSTIYIATFNPQHERWSDYPTSVRRALQVSSLFKIKPLRAAMLSIAAKMSPKEAAKAFQFLVSLGVRLMLASSTRSGSVEIPLAEASHDIYEGRITTCSKLKYKLKAIIPSDNDFEEAVGTARVQNASLARCYLRSMEMSAKKEPNPSFIPNEDPLSVSLEHVLPKKPEGNWPQFEDDEVNTYVNRLGNLVLLKTSDNSTLKSDSFEEKKKIFKDSQYDLTKQIATVNQWNSNQIRQRQLRLAKLALDTWPT